MAAPLLNTDEGHQEKNDYECKHKENPLTIFLHENNLTDMCQIFISSKLTLNNFKEMELSDLKLLSDSFNFNITQQIRLKQAVKKLQFNEQPAADNKQQISKKYKQKLTKFQSFSYRAVCIGDSRVGKSSILIKLVKNEFDQYKFPTIGAQFFVHNIPIDDELRAVIECWDTAGQEKYRDLAPLYYKGAYACLVVYDITNRESFENGKKWVQEVHHREGLHVKILLVGNKTDLCEHRDVSLEEALNYATSNSIGFIETSAKMGTNFDALREWFKKQSKLKWNLDGENIMESKLKAINLNVVLEAEEKDELVKKKCCWSISSFNMSD